MAPRRPDETNSPWLCVACDELITIGEAFSAVSVRGPEGPELRAVHYSCTVDLLVDALAERLQASAPAPGDLSELFGRMAHSAFQRMKRG